MVAITPRSFCNGSYFEPFRRLVLAIAAIERVHVYESRRKAFKDDDVLQENIIYRLTKGRKQPSEVEISSSEGPSAEDIRVRRVPFDEVVRSNDRHCFFRLPTMDADSALARKIMALGAVLKDLGLTVSTGRVVDFRAKHHLRKEPEPGTAPLIYPAHFEDGFVAWPNLESRKPNALLLDDYPAGRRCNHGTLRGAIQSKH